MFANLLSSRRSTGLNSGTEFVQAVQVNRRIGRNLWSEKLIVIGWFLIGLKTWGTFWLVENYAMPFNPWWIVLPTYFTAAICTWVYWRRN